MRQLLLGVAIASCFVSAALAQAQSASPSSAQAISEYRKKLRICTEAREKYEAVAAPYWSRVGDKRRTRIAKRRSGEPVTLSDYVLEQPPQYAGPICPRDPSVKQEDQPEDKPELPVVDDFLRNARDHFGFVPDRPKTEIEFKRAYVATASAAGISREQAVRVYSFEAGGNGKFDVQAGLETSRPGARAISTALGYNQLLTANTASLLAEKGDRFVKALQRRAESLSGDEGKKMERKADIVKRMVAVSRSVPVRWSEHVKLARTPKGLALHALNLDIDVGPLLQTQKLVDSIQFARAKGMTRTLTAAELEMMNLTGDGNGFDMLSLTPEMRATVPTSNFFLRLGYERNPIAIRTKVVEKLIAQTDSVMDRESVRDGAKELARLFE